MFKSIITVTVLMVSFSSMASSEKIFNKCFKEQLALAAQNVESHKMSDNVKHLNTGVKSCKDQVKSIVKAEKDAKKREKLEAQIKKLQAKLASGK